nr:immunoglobulin heavy chain junction region [Macaca mulatta]
CVRGSEDFDSW